MKELYYVYSTTSLRTVASNRQRLSLSKIQFVGFEKNSHVVSTARGIFEDEKSYKLLPKLEAAGRYGDTMGPENIALVPDTTRYGPLATARIQASDRPHRQDVKKQK